MVRPQSEPVQPLCVILRQPRKDGLKLLFHSASGIVTGRDRDKVAARLRAGFICEHPDVAQTGRFGKIMVKLLMQWDIKMGREQEFSEFVVREFAPRLMQLGIEPSEVLYTMYGEGPQMLTIGAVESVDKLTNILQSGGWEKLHTKLLAYVTNYQQKIVRDNGRNFQL
jgi:hypothetical protein